MEIKNDRADKVLVALGHFESRTAAQAAIAAGLVKVSGRVLRKPSEKITPDQKIEAERAHPWVSRAGLKLAHGLDEFGVKVSGLHCLDVGASTGGFTEVLLSHGAASVIAVDVGRDQLHEKLRRDERVVSFEGLDARNLTMEHLGKPPEIVVCDASFISLSKLLSVPLSLAAEGAQLVTLFKPQFEVGRENVGKGGLVSNAAATVRAEDAFVVWLEAQGWQVKARGDSSIKGGDGNAERLLMALKGEPVS